MEGLLDICCLDSIIFEVIFVKAVPMKWRSNQWLLSFYFQRRWTYILFSSQGTLLHFTWPLPNSLLLSSTWGMSLKAMCHCLKCITKENLDFPASLLIFLHLDSQRNVENVNACTLCELTTDSVCCPPLVAFKYYCLANGLGKLQPFRCCEFQRSSFWPLDLKDGHGWKWVCAYTEPQIH